MRAPAARMSAISVSCRGRSSTMTTRSSTSRPGCARSRRGCAAPARRGRRVLGGRADDQLLHVEVGRVQQPALRPRRRARRSRSARRWRRGWCPRADRRRCRLGGAPGRRLGFARPDLLADVEHRRLVALPFADDDGAVDRDAIELRRMASTADLIGACAVALPHRVRAGDRRLLDDAEEIEGEVGIHGFRSAPHQVRGRRPGRNGSSVAPGRAIGLSCG